MYPSIKSLKQIKDANAPLARQVLLAKNRQELAVLRDKHTDMFKTVNEWISSCYNEPSFHKIKMEMLNTALDMCGVEYIPAGSNAKSPAIEYLNAGDTYATTLLFVNGKYRVGCWGDIVERGNYL